MGGWKLEVFKMSLYMIFPVGLFYYFNQPQFFEEWVVKTRREVYPPINEKNKRDIEECIRAFQEKKDKELYSLLKTESTTAAAVIISKNEQELKLQEHIAGKDAF